MRACETTAARLESLGKFFVEACLVDDETRLVGHLDYGHNYICSARTGRQLRLHEVLCETVVHSCCAGRVSCNIVLAHGSRVVDHEDDMGATCAVRHGQTDAALVELP
eukprot:384497-Prymnesium_polylepis.1